MYSHGERQPSPSEKVAQSNRHLVRTIANAISTPASCDIEPRSDRGCATRCRGEPEGVIIIDERGNASCLSDRHGWRDGLHRCASPEVAMLVIARATIAALATQRIIGGRRGTGPADYRRSPTPTAAAGFARLPGALARVTPDEPLLIGGLLAWREYGTNCLSA